MWRKILAILLVFLLAAIYLLPWKAMLENRLKSELAARGMGELEFHISSVGLKEITFKDIAFGELKLPALSVNYTPLELLHGDLRELQAAEITLHKGKLEVILQGVKASLPARSWEIKAINIAGAPIILPVLSGKGTLEFTGKDISVSGNVASADKKTGAGFAFNYALEDKKSANLKIASATLPWNGGILSARDVSVPIFSDRPVSFTLKVSQVSMNSLLAAATSNRASATGSISGTVPLVVGRDGRFTVKQGSLKADKAGILKLSPEVIPSDTPQVALLRDILKDFHYSLLSMGIESADNKQLAMLLSLEGNNPDVYNGRAIKLNVHLTGDVIDLITQSMMMLNNPQQLLK